MYSTNFMNKRMNSESENVAPFLWHDIKSNKSERFVLYSKRILKKEIHRIYNSETMDYFVDDSFPNFLGIPHILLIL